MHVCEREDVGLNEVAGLEESARFLPRLEDEGHLGELRGAWANIQSVQVVPEDERGNLAGRVAFLLVDDEQEIEGIGEHVPAADSRIAKTDVLWPSDAEKVRLRLASQCNTASMPAGVSRGGSTARVGPESFQPGSGRSSAA